MIGMKHMRAAFDDFQREESGSVSIELVFIVPGLTFILLMTITFFAGFRAETQATRAATVVTDMISREQIPVTPELLDGVEGLMRAMALSDPNPDFRITHYSYDADEDDFVVDWSKDNGELGTLNDAQLNALSDRLPDMKDGQNAILVETSVEYDPVFDLGFGTRKFQNFNVTAPRFVTHLCFQEDLADPLTLECPFS